MTSPFVYRGDESFRVAFLALAQAVADRDLILRHYLHLGLKHRQQRLSDPSAVPLKKLFYALRPAASIRWLAQRPEAAVAPMHFPTLIAESEPPADVAAIIGDLLARKATTRELGTGPLPPALAEFIDKEFRWAEAYVPQHDDDRLAAHQTQCEAFFIETVRRFDLGSASL